MQIEFTRQIKLTTAPEGMQNGRLYKVGERVEVPKGVGRRFIEMEEAVRVRADGGVDGSGDTAEDAPAGNVVGPEVVAKKKGKGG